MSFKVGDLVKINLDAWPLGYMYLNDVNGADHEHDSKNTIFEILESIPPNYNSVTVVGCSCTRIVNVVFFNKL